MKYHAIRCPRDSKATRKSYDTRVSISQTNKVYEKISSTIKAAEDKEGKKKEENGADRSGSRLSNAFPGASSAETYFLARDISRSISHGPDDEFCRLTAAACGNYVESGKEATSLRKGKQCQANVARVGSLSLEFNEKSRASRLVTCRT